MKCLGDYAQLFKALCIDAPLLDKIVNAFSQSQTYLHEKEIKKSEIEKISKRNNLIYVVSGIIFAIFAIVFLVNTNNVSFLTGLIEAVLGFIAGYYCGKAKHNKDN
ncbi:MAG: hypothetical protein A2Y62_05025 [Candidatus Fischerbacteria bacterium RBG_13_37_8]|uniref:DUF2335 domain-containing protein n=1 Tax=Candidatus Fischerbacteria bacterium RBG_13_37_8 TaxID=1817863 RepID=A0A1F5VVC3_9BACT|nr:MAG: hypothetical protein A2Y62_05025 [Candidatus Fischerbacteria bacterium RBG_13_37_8]